MTEDTAPRRSGGRLARQAARADRSTAAVVPYLTRTMAPFEVVSEEGLALIEHNADTILEQVGIDFRGDPDALRLLKDAGCDVQGERVHFPRGLARTIIQKSAPRVFTQYARNPARNVQIGGNATVFGVNFADGRIKGYDQEMPGGSRKFKFFVLCVRGNPLYGKNAFHDNNDGTISDRATGLTWSKADSGKGLNWEAALAWVQQMNAAKHLGHDDWRMPSIKELQSIVDYSKSPDTTHSAAIDPVFSCSQINNEGGKPDYPCYWSGSTHVGHLGGAAAMYIAFGRAGGFLSERALAGGPPVRGQGGSPGAGGPTADDGPYRFVDVHGAGAQRSDPKTGDPKLFPHGRGPQGDVIRIFNHVRLVRGGGVSTRSSIHPVALPIKPSATPADRPAPSLVAPPNGQPPVIPNGGPDHTLPVSPMINALDTNHDGIIDADEIAHAVEALKSLDKNHDGKLTPDEYRPQLGRGGPAAP